MQKKRIFYFAFVVLGAGLLLRIILRMGHQQRNGSQRPHNLGFYNMAYVWVSSYSRWDKETSRFEDQFKEYFSSHKKAVEAATYSCKIMDDIDPDVTRNNTYSTVTSGGKLSRHYYIHRERMG